MGYAVKDVLGYAGLLTVGAVVCTGMLLLYMAVVLLAGMLVVVVTLMPHTLGSRSYEVTGQVLSHSGCQ